MKTVAELRRRLHSRRAADQRGTKPDRRAPGASGAQGALQGV